MATRLGDTSTESGDVIEIDATPDETDAAPERSESARDEPCADLPLSARIEAVLFASDRALTEARLARLLGLSGTGVNATVRKEIESLNAAYEETGRAFSIEKVAGGWQLLTRRAYASLLAGLHKERQQSRLSPAALETLSIIAYRTASGGIIRAELEAVRGVACGEVLRGLLERRMVKIIGRKEELGRPMLYGTTKHFLTVFGLASLDDLPEVAGLEKARKPRRQKPAAKMSEPDVEPETDAAAPAATPAERVSDAEPTGDGPETG